MPLRYFKRLLECIISPLSLWNFAPPLDHIYPTLGGVTDIYEASVSENIVLQYSSLANLLILTDKENLIKQIKSMMILAESFMILNRFSH